MIRLLIVLTIALQGAFAMATETEDECGTDVALRARGFNVGTNDFASAYKYVEDIINSKARNLKELKGGTIYSSVADRMITVVPVDSLDTSYGEMAGDYVLFYDFKTGTPAEVRWYEAAQKNVQYNPAVTPCATNVIPMAFNSLY